MVGGRELALVRMICLNRGQLSGLVERMSRLWLHSCQILLAGAAIYWYPPCLLFDSDDRGSALVLALWGCQWERNLRVLAGKLATGHLAPCSQGLWSVEKRATALSHT